MPIVKTGSEIVYSAPQSMDRFLQTGVIRSDAFAVEDVVDQLKQIKLNPALQATNTTVTIASQASSSGTFSLPNTAGGTLGLAGGVGGLTYNAPIDGATITLSVPTTKLVLEPAGTIAGATIVLPTLPADGYSVRFSTTAVITTLTLNAGSGDSVVNAITTLTANSFAEYVFRLSSKKWYRIG